MSLITHLIGIPANYTVWSEPAVKNRRDWDMASKIDPCDCILARRGELSQRAMWRLAKVKFPGIRLMARDYDHCGCILARPNKFFENANSLAFMRTPTSVPLSVGEGVSLH